MAWTESRVMAMFVACLFVAGCHVAPSQEANMVRDPGVREAKDKPCRKPYLESFDDGCGGWLADMRRPLPVWDGVAHCYGPWTVDPWHAPPGAGYLHLLMWIHTNPACVIDYYPGYPGNRFVQQNKSRDFRNAKVTVRLRGQIDLQGAQLCILVQAFGGKNMRANYTCTGQPIEITPDWSEQTVTLAPDPDQWVCMGQRHDRQKYGCRYGCSDIATVLKDVSVDIIFILFPLNVVPADASMTDPHATRAGKDYHVDQKYLPKGLVMFDWVKIEYPD